MPALAGLPVVVLTRPYTQSAARCFAAGMQVQGWALIPGLPSAGNTEYVEYHPLAGGSAVFIAERVYHLPDGTLIEGRGVQPDIVVEAEWGRYDVADDP